MQDVFDHIDRHAEKYLSWLTELCRRPGVAATGEGMDEALAMATELCERAGGTVETVPVGGNAPVIWADFGGQGSHTINLYNHYDVQPADPLDLWETPPFEPTIRDGKLFARGVCDDKGYLVARLAAIHAFRAVRGDLPLKVRMAAEGEEEVGSPNLENFVDKWEDRLREADACVWEGGALNLAGVAEVTLGVKGMVYVEFNCQGPKKDMHSMYGGIVPNPAWRLVRMLNDLVDPDGHINIPGFYDGLVEPDATVLGLVDSLPFDEQAELENYGLTAWQRGLTGNDLKREWILRPTANIAGIHSGYGGEGSKTVLPSKAVLKMDFRLVPAQDPAAIVRNLRTWLDENGYSDITTTFMNDERASRGDAGHPIVGALVRAAEQVGLKTMTMPNSPGTGPMYAMCDRLGLPSVSGECVGRTSSQIHSPNEHIHVEDYHRAIKHFAAFMEEYARS